MKKNTGKEILVQVLTIFLLPFEKWMPEILCTSSIGNVSFSGQRELDYKNFTEQNNETDRSSRRCSNCTAAWATMWRTGWPIWRPASTSSKPSSSAAVPLTSAARPDPAGSTTWFQFCFYFTTLFFNGSVLVSVTVEDFRLFYFTSRRSLVLLDDCIYS